MSDTWTTICQRVVPQVLQERDWQLVEDLPAFVAQVVQAITQDVVRIRPGASREETARRATIHIYCREQLYPASGEHCTLRQHRAFEEIGRHAQGVAYRYESDPDVMQICVQHAMTVLWEKRETIRDPGSLLRFVEKVVYYEILGYRKKTRREEIPMSQVIRGDEMEGNNDENVQCFWETLTAIPPPDDEIIDKELEDQLWQEVRRVLSANPRYEEVIVGCFRYGLSTSDLAALLGTSVSNIHVLKSRALKRLRDDESFIQRFADALETLADRPGEKT